MEKSPLPKPPQKEEKLALLHPTEMRRDIQYQVKRRPQSSVAWS